MNRKESTLSHFKKIAANKKRTPDKKDKPDNRKASNSKETWKRFLQDKKSKDILKKSWDSDRPKQKFGQIIKQLSQEFKKRN